MLRRQFIRNALTIPTFGYLSLRIAACSKEESGSALDSRADVPKGFKSFGYYQGLAPDELRSPNRADGTYYEMPCITEDDVRVGTVKTYDFWHGHSRKHRFTVTAANFKLLQEGKDVELLTDVVDDHRHALRISPREACGADCVSA